MEGRFTRTCRSWALASNVFFALRATGEERLILEPRQTRRLDDPVNSLFGLDAAAGTLLARADRPFLLRGVTANVADPRGTYGLALPSLREAEALGPGETGVAPWLTHTAAAGTGFRTNVAVALLEPGSEVLVTIVDDAGLVRGERRLEADAPLFWQQAVGELASDPEIPLGRVEVRVLRGSAVAYAAVVDNVTGDGLLALARRVESPAVRPYSLILSGAARAPGANGTLWRTGLRLVNPGRVPVEATLEIPGGSARASRLVPPRGVLEEPDLLGALGVPDGNAMPVRVSAAERLSVLAATRNVDPSGRPGTFAASQEPTPEDALTGPGRVLAFTGLALDSGASGFRTNVALVGGWAGARARLRLRAAAGATMAEAEFDAGPSSWTQRALSDWFGGAVVPRDATLEVTVEAGSLDAYASVIDNGTGDPAILPPAFLPVATCPPAGPAPLLSPSSSRVDAGTPLVLRLEAPGRGAGRVVPGDLPLGPGGSLSVVPAVTMTYRWIPSSSCPEDRSAPVTVEVAAPPGSVLTESGAVSGIASGGSTSFRGIPFGAPPTGPLRWRPPAPPAPWSGVRSSTAFGTLCAQLDEAGNVTGSEECLTLNVWAPAVPTASPLPVLFFIHGGGNAAGASSYAYYDGTVFAEKGRAVVVTANYRLSSFGWLARPFLSAEARRGVSGSYGTYDQLAALRWVKRNIAEFVAFGNTLTERAGALFGTGRSSGIPPPERSMEFGRTPAISGTVSSLRSDGRAALTSASPFRYGRARGGGRV